MLGKKTDAAVLDVASQSKGSGLGQAGGVERGKGDGEVDGEGVGDADDMVTGVVGGGRWSRSLVDGIAQDLDDAFGGFVVPGYERAEARAAAVDAETGNGGEDGCQRGEEGLGMHGGLDDWGGGGSGQ